MTKPTIKELEKQIKEYQQTLDKVEDTMKLAVAMGKVQERKEWIGMVQPDTMLVTIKARSKKDEVDQIQVVITKDEISQGMGAVIENVIRDTLLNIAHKGEVIKGWVDL